MLKRDNRCFFFVALMLLIISCSRDIEEDSIYYPTLMEIPPHFPEIAFPEDNTFSEARWALGKKLFFDPVMSVDSSLSCADCHLPELAFSDNRPTSPGVFIRAGKRNAPGLANVAYHPYFTREGGVPTLEMQVLVPIQEHNEFDYNIVLLGQRLSQDSQYVRESLEAYGQEPNPFVITRAIANFERSLISGSSPYDKYVIDGSDSHLSSRAIRGMALFFSDRTSCSSCHGGLQFSDFSFKNNGLYEDYEDPGRKRLTGKEEDLALFKVPSLRNVDITGPYMHDGSMSNLRDVIEHYNRGGEDHVNKSELIRPLGLTPDEQQDLLSFLLSLTDESFIKNPIFNK